MLKHNIIMDEQQWLNDNQLSMTIYDKKYKNASESFDSFLNRVSGNYPEMENLIKEKKFIFGGRILASRGVQDRKVTYSNCYVITPPEDNIESIFECASKLARTYSFGGGCGIDLSKLRPNGATVHNASKTSSGPVSFMDMFSQVTQTISQNGRRGALMISLDINHPDVEEFINCKTDLNRVNFANISVRVNDEFMKAVEEDKDYILRWPCDAKYLSSIGRGQVIVDEKNITYDHLYPIYKYDAEDNNTGEITGYIKRVKARDLFNKLVKNNWDYAEPGILYWDRIQGYNLLDNTDFKYAGVNPCVSGDTLILTSEGYQRIDNLVDKEVNIWNGYEWSQVVPKVTGHNQPMYNITFSNGCQLRCTLYHKFLLKDGNRVEAQQLKVGDKLAKYTYPCIISPGISGQSKLCYSLGVFAGDGYIKRKDEPVIYLYGEKQKLLPYIVEGKVRKDPKENRLAITIGNTKECFLNGKTFVPSQYWKITEKLDWLAGLIDADGCINSSDGSISISSIDRAFLNKVQLMLHTIGIASTVAIMHKAANRRLPSHNLETPYKEYACKESYRLSISSNNVKILLKLGLELHRINVSQNPNRDAARFISVVSIEDDGISDNVYCVNEPKNHTVVFNGIMTGNCAEEPLPAGGSCLLGSINLSEFVKNPFTSNSYIDYEALEEAVTIAVKGLNQVLSEGLKKHPLKEQQESVANWRQIGLGTLGLADMLIKLGITYGSTDSLKTIDSVYKTIAKQAVLTSLELAKVDSCYPMCDKKKLAESSFIKNLNLPTEVLKDIKKYGLYNSQLLTCAPTGSIGTMLEVSTGVEPNFAFSYTRKTQSLEGKDTFYEVKAKIVNDYLEVHKDESLENLPGYFVTSADIKPIDRVKVQAVLQKYTDASISSTVNLPKEATVEDVYDIYMNAWKEGLKGITIYRSGCKREGILTTEKVQPMEVPATKAPKRPKELEADYYTFKVKGEQYIVLVGLLNKKPYEIFAFQPNIRFTATDHKGIIIKKSKMHYSFESPILQIPELELANDNVEEKAATLYASMLLRHGVDIKYIIKTAKKVNNNIASFSAAMCRVLAKYIPSEITGEKCPECGGDVINEGGCKHCKDCGWSKCE